MTTQNLSSCGTSSFTASPLWSAHASSSALSAMVKTLSRFLRSVANCGVSTASLPVRASAPPNPSRVSDSAISVNPAAVAVAVAAAVAVNPLALLPVVDAVALNCGAAATAGVAGVLPLPLPPKRLDAHVVATDVSDGGGGGAASSFDVAMGANQGGFQPILHRWKEQERTHTRSSATAPRKGTCPKQSPASFLRGIAGDLDGQHESRGSLCNAIVT